MNTLYSYRAINDEGVVLTGSIEASNEEQARQFLLDRGLMATRLSTKKRALRAVLRDLFAPAVTHKDLILFSKQFRTLYNAGVSITQLLQILQNQTQNPTLRALTADIALHVNSGLPLHGSFAAHPRVFTPLYCSMISAGESSGALSDALERLILLLEHEYTLRNNIRSALRYPKMVLSTLFVAFIILLNVVIPRFAQVFASARLELPFPTRVTVAMNKLLLDWWWVLLLVSVASLFCWRWWVRTPTGRYARDRLLLALPVLGTVLIKSIIARFAFIFAMLQRSGVGVLESLDILSATIGNAAFEREFVQIKEQLRSGYGIAQPLGMARYFTPLAINMVAVGEDSGNLEAMLTDLARHYDEEVAYAVSDMTESAGPMLVLALSVVVGFFALAVFLPMWDMVQLVR